MAWPDLRPMRADNNFFTGMNNIFLADNNFFPGIDNIFLHGYKQYISSRVGLIGSKSAPYESSDILEGTVRRSPDTAKRAL
jgi:hypothetical protein